jgi:hypothetical protein
MKPSLLRLSLPWLLLAAVALLAVVLRYRAIEPTEMAHLCESAAGRPAWCAWRQALVLGFLSYGYGWAALAGAALALVWKHPSSAWLAAALGLFALQMYCYEAGAFAALVGCLRLLRAQADLLPGDEDGQGDGEVQPQP